ncbi:GNAT family N-acetyltransferase [Candidatus Stoquefichus sp. SB1]|uniref:GNAT family N-acetyltransferase n=1 Tax=Candidatus Stoquefichus sp. SB1 TaxID=1658109 RepID=UPI00067F69D0|nr:GNAT family N-acetyltransferase [Candidatus Stoquefichus sp. SB1]
MEFSYKYIEETDLKSCAYLFQEAFLQEPWYEEWTYHQAYERLSELMSSKAAIGYVIYDQEKLIGMILGRRMTYLDKRQFWVDELCISQHYQGQHLGSRLLDYAKQECQKIQIYQMVLNTIRGGLSESFYHKNGFHEEKSLVCMSCDFECDK